MIQLIDKDGTLYYPETVKDAYGEPSPIVLCRYDAGDCDTIDWPKFDAANLKRALFDDREMGLIPYDDTHVTLPDGFPFEI